MRVVVVALGGVFDSGLSVMLDILGAANSTCENLAVALAGFDIIVVGLTVKARTEPGLRVETVL
ncbi:MAG: hypothetical protein QJR12_03560 [Mycobacterium sp.]|uniref:hypothetical protein n=1 Tax=Mycobacterium sp. TaxID=1785 RepID=UPI0026070769|nr:hypothetical protein [Mycobacterium sp.]MDI3313382.1 hypothetical protein [Mycobacterium sp.]